jgi:hypothetical protein
MGIHLRIKRFNLQSQIHVRFPTRLLQTTKQMNKFTDSFQKLNHLIEHSDSDKVTSKKTQPNFL